MKPGLMNRRRVALIAVVLATTAAGCGGSGVRLIASVRPLPTLTRGRCIDFIARHEARGKLRLRRAYAGSVCSHEPANAHWFDWRVTNASNESTFAYCSAVAYGAHGRKLWTRSLGLVPIPWTVELRPGGSFRLRRFFQVPRGTTLPGRVARYEPICRTSKTPLS
jgi:hypothetical protein